MRLFLGPFFPTVLVSLAALVLVVVILELFSCVIIRLRAVMAPHVLIRCLISLFAFVALCIVRVGPRLIRRRRLPVASLLFEPQAIIRALLVIVAQHIVGLGDLLEALFRLASDVGRLFLRYIGMELLSKLVKILLNVLLLRILLDAEDLVVVQVRIDAFGLLTEGSRKVARGKEQLCERIVLNHE